MASVSRKKDPYSKLDKSLSPEIAQQLTIALQAFNEGKWDLCANLSQQVLQHIPNQPQAANLLANSLHNGGRTAEGYAFMRQLLQVHPQYAQAHQSAGLMCEVLGQYDAALQHLYTAHQLGQRDSALYLAIGHVHFKKGDDYAAAARGFGEALRNDRENDKIWELFSEASRAAKTLELDDALLDILAKSLKRHTLFENAKGYITCTYLSFGMGLNLAMDNAEDLTHFSPDLFEEPQVQKAINSPLLLNYIEHHIVCAFRVEQLLTYLRGYLFTNSIRDETQAAALAKKYMKFVRALEKQCYRNEYVNHATSEEQTALQEVKTRIESLSPEEWHSKQNQWLITLYACYEPLTTLREELDVDTIHKGASSTLKDMLKRHILDRREEMKLGQALPALHEVQEDTSVKVRAMYEENPYPRWETLPETPSNGLHRELKHFVNPEMFDSLDSMPNNPEVLIAGCGTGSHALQTHNRLKPKEILAVDLSRASLGYAARKTNERSIENIYYTHGDIMELSSINRQFDVVESVGVIHHMKVPEQGLENLVTCMKPNGLLHLGLYSELARKTIVKCRDLIAEKGWPHTAEGIRAFREYIFKHATDENGYYKLQELKDFFNTSGTRDLVFHVQEHRYTIPQIKAMLDKYDLEFMGFEIGKEKIYRQFDAMMPEKGSRWSLECWDRFEQENPGTFIAMYQFWARKKPH